MPHAYCSSKDLNKVSPGLLFGVKRIKKIKIIRLPGYHARHILPDRQINQPKTASKIKGSCHALLDVFLVVPGLVGV